MVKKLTASGKTSTGQNLKKTSKNLEKHGTKTGKAVKKTSKNLEKHGTKTGKKIKKIMEGGL